jgi:ribonuclease-3
MTAQRLQKAIGYEFKNEALLVEAITHPSLAHEHAGQNQPHNQRLEFLGDAVLQLLLTDHLYRQHPTLPEGQLTQLRAHLANRHSLHRRANAISLGKFLLLGKGEENSGGRERLSNLADAYEALIGAIYLDGGIRAAKKFIGAQFKDEFQHLRQSTPRQNPKGQLQELLQAHSNANPRYRVVHESGPDHHKNFEAVVEWQGEEIGRGTGTSKKQAESVAAESALTAFESGKLQLRQT